MCGEGLRGYLIGLLIYSTNESRILFAGFMRHTTLIFLSSISNSFEVIVIVIQIY